MAINVTEEMNAHKLKERPATVYLIRATFDCSGERENPHVSAIVCS